VFLFVCLLAVLYETILPLIDGFRRFSRSHFDLAVQRCYEWQ
jgi:hypothetical protein